MISTAVAYASWSVVPTMKIAQIQPISSTVATVAGILFGFVMASVTMIASAKGNKLVQNTQKTKYLPKLVKKLHTTMGFLLFVCVIFLICLFIPDQKMVATTGLFSTVKILSVILVFGVFILSFSICQFISVWREFSKFASHM